MSCDICKHDIDSYCYQGLDYCRQHGCQNKTNGKVEPYLVVGPLIADNTTNRRIKSNKGYNKPPGPLKIGSYHSGHRHKSNKQQLLTKNTIQL